MLRATLATGGGLGDVNLFSPENLLVALNLEFFLHLIEALLHATTGHVDQTTSFFALVLG